MPSDQAFPSGEGCGAGVASAVMAGREPLTADQRNSFVAALLGWMMDAFDYFLVLPWHFKEGILQREQEFRAQGGKFIFPFPEIEII